MAQHSAAAKRPEPLLNRAAVVAAVSGLVSILVTLGVLTPAAGGQLSGLTETAIGAAFTLVSVAGPIAHAIASRGAVTPVADPVAADGTPLVKAGSALGTSLDADAALAEADTIHPASG